MIKNLEANHLYIVQVAGATKSIFEKNPQYIFGKYSEPKTISLKGMVVTKYTFDCCYSYCAFGGRIPSLSGQLVQTCVGNGPVLSPKLFATHTVKLHVCQCLQ